jgi:hypothetical protein
MRTGTFNCMCRSARKLRAVTTEVPALIQALQDPEKEVRECASGALEEIGTREAKATLKALRSRKPADA